MSGPTQPLIAAEIGRLEQLKREVPEFTLFGEQNHCAIDAQVMVLRGADPVTAADKCASTCDDTYVRDLALEAAKWLATGNCNPPSTSWGGAET